MRLLVLAAVAALAVPASAQSHLADSSGVFLGASTSLGYGGSAQGAVGEVEGLIGYRRANGLDYGLRGSVFRSTASSALAVGPTIGYTRPLDDRTWIRIQGDALYTGSDYASRPHDITIRETGETIRINEGVERTIQFSALSAVASAGLGRSYRLGGSFRFDPSVGVYGQVRRVLQYDATGFEDVPSFNTDRVHDVRGALGLRLDLPLSFRLLGADLTLIASPEIPLVGGRSGVPSRGGLRINF